MIQGPKRQKSQPYKGAGPATGNVDGSGEGDTPKRTPSRQKKPLPVGNYTAVTNRQGATDY
jgi:hypothetical protein